MEWVSAAVFAATSVSFLAFLLKCAEELDKSSPWAGDIVRKHVNSANPKKWVEVSKLLRQLGLVVFNRVYGNKPLSINFFTRSSVVSVVMWIIITSFCLLTGKYIAVDGVNIRTVGFAFMITGILFISTNVIGDYLSLMITRFLLGRVAKSQGFVESFFYIICDFVGTVICFAIVFHFLFPFTVRLLGYDLRYPLNVVGDALWFASFGHSTILIYKEDFMSPLLLPFFANLFTSMWIWLTVAASSSATVLFAYAKILRFMNGNLSHGDKQRFDFANRPVESIMWLVIAFVIFSASVLVIIQHL